jgi:elongation factor Ts
MANFSAADVKKLRELTGAGMMDCKRALDESDGDFDKAVELLRIKGAKDIGKRAERTTAEGLVAAAGGALIELDSETDFVAKNSEFQQLAELVVNAAAELDAGAGVETVLAAPLGTGTVADAINAASVKLGEKLELRRVVKYDAPTTVYLHKRSADLPPSIGVLVQYTGDSEKAAEAARGAAMQIASLKAKYVSRAEIPADVVESEKRIAEATAREEGKPEGALPKIVEGRVNGFYKDAVLVEQSSVLDSKKTVGALLTDAGVTVTAFSRFEVGTA